MHCHPSILDVQCQKAYLCCLTFWAAAVIHAVQRSAGAVEAVDTLDTEGPGRLWQWGAAGARAERQCPSGRRPAGVPGAGHHHTPGVPGVAGLPQAVHAVLPVAGTHDGGGPP